MPEETAKTFASGSSTQSLFYVIAMLLLIFVAAYFVTKFVGGRSKMGMSQGRLRRMRIVETLPMGRDRNIVLVEVGGKYCLLGVTGQNINLLECFDPAQVTALEMEEGVMAGTAKGVAGWITNLAQKRNNTKGTARAEEQAQMRPQQQARRNTQEEDEIDEILQSIQARKDRLSGGRNGDDRG
ncbi:flagellar biosynthetic protein FliO [Eubacteriales bacterium OttesenSCG-928-M02]|nr:flagellar biosynthetic protein FliO [Eubacteriales bacterium OttesenSCG-928-M02]